MRSKIVTRTCSKLEAEADELVTGGGWKYKGIKQGVPPGMKMVAPLSSFPGDDGRSWKAMIQQENDPSQYLEITLIAICTDGTVTEPVR